MKKRLVLAAWSGTKYTDRKKCAIMIRYRLGKKVANK